MSDGEKIVGVIESAALTGMSFTAVRTFMWAIYFTDQRLIVARTVSQLQNIGRTAAIGGGGAVAGGLLGRLFGGKTGGTIGAIAGGIAGTTAAYKTELDTQQQQVNSQMNTDPDNIVKADPKNFAVPYSDIEALYIMHNPLATVVEMKMMLKIVTVSGKKYSFIIRPDSLRNLISSEKVEYEDYTNLLKSLLGDKLKVNQWKNF